MKLSWRRLVFFALLMFIVPFMIVYSTNKNGPTQILPASQPEPPTETPAQQENPASSELNLATGPFTYVTGHNKETYTMLYYPDRQSLRLVPVAKRLSGYEPSLEEALAALLDANYAPPGLNKPAFRPGTRLLSVGVIGSTAIIDFGEGLLPKKAASNDVSLIIKTVENVARQFPYEKLEIRVNGKRVEALPQGMENPVSLINRPTDSYVVYRPLITNGLVYLYPETVDEPSVPAKLVNGVLDSLSRNVADLSKKVYISPEVRLLSASVQNGQVTLNFNRALQDNFAEFAKQFTNRQMAENFFFDAIILSLTEMPGIQEVRFLVEGKQVNSLNNPTVGNFTFARPKNINPVN